MELVTGRPMLAVNVAVLEAGTGAALGARPAGWGSAQRNSPALEPANERPHDAQERLGTIVLLRIWARLRHTQDCGFIIHRPAAAMARSCAGYGVATAARHRYFVRRPVGRERLAHESLAGAVAPRAEARARVGFGPGGLAVRWRSFVRVAGWRRTPPARRPRLAREGGPRARHRGQRACSLSRPARARSFVRSSSM